MNACHRILLNSTVIFLVSACGGGGGSSESERQANPDPTIPNGSDSIDIIEFNSPRNWSIGLDMTGDLAVATNPSTKVTPDQYGYVTWIEQTNNTYRAQAIKINFNEEGWDFTATQLSNNGADVIPSNGFQTLKSQAGSFVPGLQLAAGSDNIAHVAWLQREGSELSLWTSITGPSASEWTSEKPFELNLSDGDSFQLVESDTGQHVLFIVRNTPQSSELLVSQYFANTNAWSDPQPIDSRHKPNSAVSVVFNESIASVFSVALNADGSESLVEVVLNRSENSVSTPKPIATFPEIASVKAVSFQGRDHVFFIAEDLTGDLSVMGLADDGTGYRYLPTIEFLDQDAGHLDVATVADQLHLVWKQEYSDSTSTWVFDDLITTVFDGSMFSTPQTLFNSGAAHPILMNGEDDALYLIWYSQHTNYRSFAPDSGWSPTSRPFCNSDNSLSCYNSGEQHAISVNGDVGLMAWVSEVEGKERVFLSFSTNE